MDAGIFDALIVAVLVMILPLFGVWGHRRLQLWLEMGIPGARTRAYRLTILVQWILVLVVLGIWSRYGREFRALGLGSDGDPGFWIGTVVAFAASACLFLQTAVVIKHREKLLSVRRQVESLEALLPHTDGETRWFMALSVTAGVCEELLFRGYLIALFAGIFNMWWAVVLSSVAFGLGHAYQGMSGIAKTAALGFVMAGLYLLGRSLLGPMLLHAALDVNGGILGRRAIERPRVIESGNPDS